MTLPASHGVQQLNMPLEPVGSQPLKGGLAWLIEATPAASVHDDTSSGVWYLIATCLEEGPEGHR